MNPDAPWLTADAVKILTTLLKPTDVGFEWGAGKSTLWFARRVSHLTSVEHNDHWHATVKERIDAAGLKNVDLVFASLEGNEKSTYVQAIRNVKDASLDFVLVDGRLRSLCTLAAIPKIRPGGILIIDNINEYIPCSSYAPDSRREADGPKDEGWASLIDILRSYRCIWTDNGKSNTAIYFLYHS